MNKNMKMMLAMLAAGLLLTGCGTATESTPESSGAAVETETAAEETAAETTAEETTAPEAETEAPAEAETEAEAAPQTEAPAAEDADAPTADEAKAIVNAVRTLERLGGCGIEFDSETESTIGGETYYKVTATDFVGTADIRAIEEQYFTPEMIAERYEGILGTETPLYIDAEDALYMRNMARGFYIFTETEPKVEKSSEDGYSILAEFDNTGAVDTADIRVVKAGGAWKVCGITFGM